MSDARSFQQDLLKDIIAAVPPGTVTEALREAYLNTPRHKYIRRYKFWEEEDFSTVPADGWKAHLPRIYSDRSLVVAARGAYDAQSSNSQPSFILRLLSALDIRQGHSVLEVGSGTGWLGAIIAHLVGADGVYTGIEISDVIARESVEAIRGQHIPNAHIIIGDGGLGHSAHAPYDRAIFTTGTYHFPEFLFDQIKEGGKVVLPIKSKGISDNVVLLRRDGDTFVSELSIAGSFVRMQGLLDTSEVAVESLNQTLTEMGLGGTAAETTPFWWGRDAQDSFVEDSTGFRLFVDTFDPRYRLFRLSEDRGLDGLGFGLRDDAAGFVLIWHDYTMARYGNAQAAGDAATALLHRWCELGMPSGTRLNLSVAKAADAPVEGRSRSWTEIRRSCLFTWSVQ